MTKHSQKIHLVERYPFLVVFAFEQVIVLKAFTLLCGLVVVRPTTLIKSNEKLTWIDHPLFQQ